MQSINPANLEIISSYNPHNEEEIESKINLSHQDFLIWKNESLDVRKNLLLKVADELRKNSLYHAKTITSEMGKPIKESQSEVEKCAWVCEYYAENSIKFLSDKEIQSSSSKSYLSYEPLGLILGVMPWNFPYWQVFRFIAPCLMAGNACLLKHASNVSGCALAIEEIIKNIYPLKNLLNVLLIKPSQVENVVKNDFVKAVTLTGSDEAGSSVASLAGKEIKKSLLELGGSDPFIVLSDANIDNAVKMGVKSRFLNSGQSCIAAKRFIVDKEVYDEFIAKVKIEIENLKMDDPSLGDTDIGPLAKEEFSCELKSLVDNSVKKGARLLLGGNAHNCFFEPTLLIDVTESMDVFKKETFGPVLCVSKSESDNHALELANNSCYGLSASIWTESSSKAACFVSGLNAGAVFVNDMSKSDPRLPFGGINKSGYGRELSELGLKEFVNIKTVVYK